MTTTRLYYTDAIATSFEATVTACDVVEGRLEVVLDQTAFYPTSGGQPHDTGTLEVPGEPEETGQARVRVVDVIDRDDGAIAHVVEAPVPVGRRVRGEIDWPRRFDHMQQHTGQHILSAAFDRTCRARTVSFHLGSDGCTIDLDRVVTPREIAAAEEAASQVVWDDRPVTVRFATEEEASRLPLRKEPARTGLLRLVDVTGFDLSACGGTHVPQTGRIGVIAVSGWEKFKGGTRVAFVCGGRALRAYGQLRDAVAAATKLISVSADELPAAVERLQGEMKTQSRAIRQFQEEVAGHRASKLRAEAETIRDGLRSVLREAHGWDAPALKLLAQAIVSEPGYVVVLVGDGQPAPVVIARSVDVTVDAGAWMTRATAALGGRGGGRPELAQGGLAASADRILSWAKNSLGEQL